MLLFYKQPSKQIFSPSPFFLIHFYDKYKKKWLSGQKYSGGRFISILTNQSPNTHPFHTLSSSNPPPLSFVPGPHLQQTSLELCFLSKAP